MTWIDARAMQRGQCSIERGQCSIVDPRAFGLMLRPQRGQFRNDIGARTRGIQLATLNGPRSMISPPSPESGESQSSQAWRRALGWTTSMIVRASLGTSDEATPDAPIVCRPGDLLGAGGSVDNAHL